MDAALNDDVGIDLGGFLGELQGIADDVGDAVKNLRCLVVVREDNRIALLLQPVDCCHIGRVDRPFDARDMMGDTLVEMLGLRRDLGRV